MNLTNPPKALIVLIALLCVTALMMFDRIQPEAGLGLLGLIVGYGIGNGIAAKQGDPVEPIFGTSRRDRRVGDHVCISQTGAGVDGPPWCDDCGHRAVAHNARGVCAICNPD